MALRVIAFLCVSLHSFAGVLEEKLPSFEVTLNNTKAEIVTDNGGKETQPLPKYTYDDKSRLRASNKVFLYGNLLGAATLFALPESVTNWDKSQIKNDFKWWNNVSHIAVWDKDDWFLNYVTHPYWSAIYYVKGRMAGYNKVQSTGIAFLYSFAWEYGIEAFAEKPSAQDLISTPLGGALFGEMFFNGIKSIQANDYTLLNSRFLGKAAIFAMDPLHFIVNRVHSKRKVHHTTHYGITSKGGPMLTVNVDF